MNLHLLNKESMEIQLERDEWKFSDFIIFTSFAG